MKGCTQDPSPLKHLKVPLLLILYKLAFFFLVFIISQLRAGVPCTDLQFHNCSTQLDNKHQFQKETM